MAKKTYIWLQSKLFDGLDQLKELRDIEDVDKFAVGMLSGLVFLRGLWIDVRYLVVDILDYFGVYERYAFSVVSPFDALMNETFNQFVVELMKCCEQNSRLGVLNTIYKYLEGALKWLNSPVGLEYVDGREVRLWDLIGWVCEYKADQVKYPLLD
ncbi:MAG: hypothetical protein N2509_08690, partial [Treponemataceae bacterium]|nr:hypothetical protein [Treponemataceae bacterium]